MPPRILKGRKLLVASIGVASVSYVTGCSAFSDPGNSPTSGNLLAPPAQVVDNPLPPTSGHLVGPPEVPPPPPPPVTPSLDAGLPPTSGNLVSPPVADEDAGTDADAG